MGDAPRDPRRRGRGRRQLGNPLITLNANSWQTAKDILTKLPLKHTAAVCGQERRLFPHQLGEASASALTLGWKIVFTAAAVGNGGGLSAGVYLAFPKHVIVTQLDGSGTWDFSPPGSDGRIVAAWADLYVRGGIVVISVYMWCSEGLSLRNLSVLDAVGCLVKSYGMPWIMAGDLKFPPEVLEKGSLG